MKFTEFDFDADILKGVEAAGFTECTPVQEKTYKYSLKGKDVYVQSQTGTGKTAAFLLTIYKNFKNPKFGFNKKALIIAPTRELAVQIEKDADELGKFLDLKAGCFYGGAGYKSQEDKLRSGVDIFIGTPGRLIDFVQKKMINLKEIGYLVIDEADRLFDMGFFPDIRKIVRKMLPYNKRQTMLFSATMSVAVKQMSWEYMNNPVTIEIEPEHVTVDAVEQYLYHVGKKEKINLVIGLLNKHLPRNVLIFTNMKSTAVRVHKYLQFNGKSCRYLTGDLPQSKRLKIINDFKSGKLDILIATDVAARGLHVENLEMIINYDLPGDFENYVHRIGRTARAGKSGIAISLACENYIFNLEAIEKYIGGKIPVLYADDEMFEKVKRIPDKEFYNNSKSRKKQGAGGRKKSIEYSEPKHKKYKKREKPAIPGDKKKSGDRVDKRPDKKKKNNPVHLKSSSKKINKTGAGKGSVKKAMSPEERLEYYKKKYGDSFSFSEAPKKKKGPVLKKIFSVFKSRG